MVHHLGVMSVCGVATHGSYIANIAGDNRFILPEAFMLSSRNGRKEMEKESPQSVVYFILMHKTKF